MATADPTYPLYPIACILAAAMLLLVLLTSFIRQSWNLGVAFLCFWLFLENLTIGAGTIIWADNAEVKLYVYCDIVSHMQVVTAIVRPMATLIITRRLYLITSLQSVELPDAKTKRRNVVIEWALGLAIPVLVAGPLYYSVQDFRFVVLEGFGCANAQDNSILGILFVKSWAVIPPLLSICIYYPRVVRTFYNQSREINHFLQSNNSVSRTNYFRILALASIDILITLPFGIAIIALAVHNGIATNFLPFYPGWKLDHADWEPESIFLADLENLGISVIAQTYFVHWTSPVLAFAIFGLFGVTAEARASYWRAICTVCGWFGWKPTLGTRSPLGAMEFGERPQDKSFNLDIGSRTPSFINPDAHLANQGTTSAYEGVIREPESSLGLKMNQDPGDVINETPNIKHLETEGEMPNEAAMAV